MTLVARSAVLLLAVAAVGLGASRVTSVEPTMATPGGQAVAAGDGLAKGMVVKLFLTADGKDIELEMIEQSTESIEFAIPADVQLGRYRLMIQTGGTTPALMEQPVFLEVMTAAEMEKRRKEEEQLTQAPEPPPAPPAPAEPPQ